MGHSQSLAEPQHVHRGRRLADVEHALFQNLWNGAVQSDSDRMSLNDFTAYFRKYGLEEISRYVFTYLSLKNESIEKDFMESRLLDLIAHDTSHHPSFVVAPWETLMQAVDINPSVVLAIATHLSRTDVVSTEARSITELIAQIPSIQSVFNRSAVQFIMTAETWKPEISCMSSEILAPENAVILCMLVSESSGHDIDMLYSTTRDGFSFRSMAPAIRHYSGELIFVCKDSQNRIFGAYSNRENWSETLDKFDTRARTTFLFQISPEVRVRRVTMRGGSNCIYFNASNSNHPIGIGFGGQVGTTRLWLDGTDLSKANSMDFDATFDSGQLLSHTEDQQVIESRVQVIEVFGLGGSTALEEQQSRREAEQEARLDRKKVDRMKLVQNEFDKEMLFSKTFKQGADRLGS